MPKPHKTYEQILREDIRNAKETLSSAKHDVLLAKLNLQRAIALKKRHYKHIARDNRILRKARETKAAHEAKKCETTKQTP